jgi:hypothetical protein
MSGRFVVAGARRGFALGLSLGLAFATAAFVFSGKVAVPAATRKVDPQQASASVEAWHAGVTQGSLSAAVHQSMGLLPGAGAAAGGPSAAKAPEGHVRDLLARAEEHRRKREFTQACVLYAEVVARGAMTADAWADFADAQASVDGRIAGDPARYLAAALALDPQHPKALWLQASLAHEERRYADALATWRRLLAVVPPDSSDARIVEANIAEATRLAKG